MFTRSHISFYQTLFAIRIPCSTYSIKKGKRTSYSIGMPLSTVSRFLVLIVALQIILKASSFSLQSSRYLVHLNQQIPFTSTILKGIDYDAFENDEECDFYTGEMEMKPTSASSSISEDGSIATLEAKVAAINPNCIELPDANPDITPEEVVSTCMNFLQNNDEPRMNSGLEVCWNFSSDSCRAANGGSLEAFYQYARNPVFQTMVNCESWEVLSVGPEIAGTPTRGAMKTVLVHVVQQKEKNLKDRRFVWTMMRERRPPRQGCWLVHECLSVDNAFAHTE